MSDLALISLVLASVLAGMLSEKHSDVLLHKRIGYLLLTAIMFGGMLAIIDWVWL